MIRNINVDEITKNIKEMCIEANHYLSSDMKEAIDKSFELLKYIKGKKALLFSPGGSSLEFKNYVERGRYFELMVKNHE